MEDTVDFNIQVLEEAGQLSQLQEEDSLTNCNVDDVLDEDYTTLERWSVGQGFENIFVEMRRGETIEQCIRQERPEVIRDDMPWNPDRKERQVGWEHAGRLIRMQGSGGEGTLGVDMGSSGGATSIEEATMHIIRDDQDEDDNF